MHVAPGEVGVDRLAKAHRDAPQGSVGEVPPAEYVYKLWLGHGITTVREVGAFNGLRWTLDERRRSAAHEIVAPRIAVYAGFPVAVEVPGGVRTPEEARRWVDSIAGSTGARQALLPPENATGNYVKVVERIPVKLRVRDSRLNGALRPGMNVEVTIYTR